MRIFPEGFFVVEEVVSAALAVDVSILVFVLLQALRVNTSINVTAAISTRFRTFILILSLDRFDWANQDFSASFLALYPIDLHGCHKVLNQEAQLQSDRVYKYLSRYFPSHYLREYKKG